jgi:hypothetical protein
MSEVLRKHASVLAIHGSGKVENPCLQHLHTVKHWSEQNRAYRITAEGKQNQQHLVAEW